MNELPIIEFKIRHMGEALATQMMLRNEEINNYIIKGVDKAVLNIEKIIIDQVVDEVQKQIQIAIENFFRYGEGSIFIKENVDEICSNIIKKE